MSITVLTQDMGDRGMTFVVIYDAHVLYPSTVGMLTQAGG